MVDKCNGHKAPADKCSRRQFMRNSAILGAALLTGNVFDNASPLARRSMPMIKLGNFKVSRLILGANPFWGFWHGNPRKPQNYTNEGRKAVMDAAAEQGITAIWVPAYKEWISLWKEYKDGGGKLETWMGQPDGGRGVTVEDQITGCSKNSGKAICIQGVTVDAAVGKGDFEKLKRWLGMIHDCGLPAGMASHRPENILRAVDNGLNAEFLHLTLGVPDSFQAEARENTLKTVMQIDKPMVVFKVLGAGRFEPTDAIPYVLKKIGRMDGLCIGVDNPAQIAQNADLVLKG